MTYNLCSSCAAAIMNDDYSGLDFEGISITDFVEASGLLCVADSEAEISNNSWTCEACNREQDGTGAVLETVSRS